MSPPRTDLWQELHEGLAPGPQPDGGTFAAPLGARSILLPIRPLGDGRLVASLIVTQASFAVLDALCDALAARLAPHRPDLIVALPTLGLPLAEGVARRLGHARYVPLGTTRKPWYDGALSVPLTSTTSQGEKRLYLDPRTCPLLTGRIALIDDVLSSGASIAAALDLLALAEIAPAVIGAAMAQGEAWRARTAALPVETALATPIWSPP